MFIKHCLMNKDRKGTGFSVPFRHFVHLIYKSLVKPMMEQIKINVILKVNRINDEKS